MEDKLERDEALVYIIECISPLITKYPFTEGAIASMFLAAIGIAYKLDPIMFATSTATPVERLKAKIIESIPSKEKTEVAILEMLTHQVQMAVLSLQLAKPEGVVQIKDHFLDLKRRNSNLETFLCEELGMKTTNAHSPLPFNDMMAMFRAAGSSEDFILQGKVENFLVRQAIQKYFALKDGTVTFMNSNPNADADFNYVLSDGKKGFCTVTNWDRLQVTLV